MKKLYAIQYRSMRTAVHGLMVFENKADAEAANNAFIDLDKNTDKYNDSEIDEIVTSVYYSQPEEYQGKFDEIDYRKITKENTYTSYDYLIEILNNVAYDVYD